MVYTAEMKSHNVLDSGGLNITSYLGVKKRCRPSPGSELSTLQGSISRGGTQPLGVIARTPLQSRQANGAPQGLRKPVGAGVGVTLDSKP